MDRRTAAREAKFRAGLWIETALAGAEWDRTDLSEDDAEKVEAELELVAARLIKAGGRISRRQAEQLDDPDQMSILDFA